MKTSRILSFTMFAGLGLLPVMEGCAADTAQSELTGEADSKLAATLDPAGPFTPPSKVFQPPSNYVQVAAGKGWRQLTVTGPMEDIDTGETRTVNDDIIVVENDAVLADAPLPAFAKKEIGDEAAVRKSKPGVDPDDDDLLTVVHKASAERVEAQDLASANAPNAPTLLLSCSNFDKVITKSTSTTKTASFHKGDEAGAFTGSLDFDAKLTASASGSLKLRVKRKWCIPYSVAFKRVDIQGQANVTATLKADGKFEKAWSFEKEIAKPTIATFDFLVGPIPVHLGFNAPIDAGLTASTKAEVDLDARVDANGAFNVGCTSSDCTGSKSASFTFTNNKGPSAAAQARIKVTPYAQASVRAYLYTESLAYGQVGVKAKLDNDLFFYAGNTCGDANNDGVNEVVKAGTLDMAVGIDVIAKVDTVATSAHSWDWPVYSKHVGFWDLIGSDAIAPIFYRSGGLDANVTMSTRMRPCWPYSDDINYRIDWSDGASTTFVADPAALTAKLHTFATNGVKPIKVTAISDQLGRSLGESATRSVLVSPIFIGGFDPTL